MSPLIVCGVIVRAHRLRRRPRQATSVARPHTAVVGAAVGCAAALANSAADAGVAAAVDGRAEPRAVGDVDRDEDSVPSGTPSAWPTPSPFMGLAQLALLSVTEAHPAPPNVDDLQSVKPSVLPPSVELWPPSLADRLRARGRCERAHAANAANAAARGRALGGRRARRAHARARVI